MKAHIHHWARELGMLFDHASLLLVRRVHECHEHAADGYNKLAKLLHRDEQKLTSSAAQVTLPLALAAKGRAVLAAQTDTGL